MTESALPSLADDLELLRSSAVAAGIVAAGYFRRDLKTWTKANASPVTEADITVDRYLRAGLMAARPSYGWLSEESADDGSRLTRPRVFIIDPIDGTRGFIRGDDSWTISLAVIEAGVAVAGVVYAPVRDEMFAAARGLGARRNGHPIRRTAPTGPPVILAAGAVHAELKAAGLVYERGAHLPSLAYRLCQVASGTFAAAAVRRGASDWDIAGAAAILSECGIGFIDVCRDTMRFDRPDTRNGALAATADAPLQTLLKTALLQVYGCPDDTDAPDPEGLTT